MKFKVCVKETLERVIEVEADSRADAISEVHVSYCNEDIVLDAEDFKGVDFFVLEEV